MNKPKWRSLSQHVLPHCAAVVIVAVSTMAYAAPPMGALPSKVQAPRPMDGRRLSMLVEQGFVLPSQFLVRIENEGNAGTSPPAHQNRAVFTDSMKLPVHLKTGVPFNVTFTIAGNARFDNPQGLFAIDGVDDGVIMTPPIVAGPTVGESFVNVVVSGRTVIEKLRVMTLESGGIDNLKQYIGADDPGLIVLGDHYAVLDESQMGETTQAVAGWIEVPSKRTGHGTEDLSNRVAAPIDAQNAALGLCFRVPWGPGRVNWHWSSSNPWATGGWAYKPERLRVVYRADDLASDAIDALYRKSWGCGVAYKVPDSCTVEAYQNNTWKYCCNAAAWAAGHRVGFVNPREVGGPNCPPR